MRLESIRPGDIVLVSKGGRRFHGTVVRIREGVVEVTPIERGITYRHASARELLGAWHRAGSRRAAPDDEGPVEVAKGQLSLAGRLDPAT